jgi:hypothetical protein
VLRAKRTCRGGAVLPILPMNKPQRSKRVAVLADFHSGHEFGLTPPAWWNRRRTNQARVSKAGDFQRKLWAFYSKSIDTLKPIHILIVNGDSIEGKGERSGGMELITSDRNEQVRMAREAIEYAEAPIVRLTYGTRYHTGRDEDFEAALKDQLAASGKCKAEIHGHDFLNVNGVNLDIKHKVGSSSVPYGRTTAISKDRVWNVIWNSEHERQPKADILIRSHVHYHTFAGSSSWLGVTTPALTYNSAFGIRECAGLVDVGFMVFDFDENGGYSWRAILADFDKLKVQPTSL